MTNALPSRARLAVSFLFIAVVWGSTWLVIKDQIGTVPPGWGATWRFVVASLGMVALAKVRGESLWMPAGGQRLAMIVGVTQFCMNFQFVYRAEHYLTSGLVAVLYALLLVPNALLAKLVLGTPLKGRFLAGSAVALAGIAMLLLHEYRVAPPAASVFLGIALACGGLLSASAANIAQATPSAQRIAVVPLSAWAMMWGAAANFVVSWVIYGPPVFDPHPQYIAGVVYLALIGSVLTFPVYFWLIRTVGAGRAAYNGVLVPVVAMGLSTVFEGYQWSLLAAAGALVALMGLLIALSSGTKNSA